MLPRVKNNTHFMKYYTTCAIRKRQLINLLNIIASLLINKTKQKNTKTFDFVIYNF